MNKKTLTRILKSDPEKFTLREIEEMMDEELNKDTNEMDTDFIDLCADALEKGMEEHKVRKTPKSVKRVLSVAATIALIACLTVSVGADNRKKASDKFVVEEARGYTVNFENGRTNAKRYSDENDESVKKFAEYEFYDVVFPKAILSDDYTKNYIIKQYTQREILGEIDFENSETGVNGYLAVTRIFNPNYKSKINYANVSPNYIFAEEFFANGMDVVLFSDGKDSQEIHYCDGNTGYTIVLKNCPYDTAVEIIRSLE